MKLNDEELSEFYIDSTPFIVGLEENEYLVLVDSNDKVIDKFCYQNGELRKVKFVTLRNRYIKAIKPRNEQQVLALDMLDDETSKVKLLRGVYGTGKDHLMLNHAIAQLEAGLYDKIVYVRPNVTVANVPDIGFLKGSVDEQLEWTLAPFYDKVGGKDGVERLISDGQLETVPLLYIRGRSFENSIIYVTEGQNMTTEIVKLLISRIGEGSVLYINGDTHQVDKKVYDALRGKTVSTAIDDETISRINALKAKGYLSNAITSAKNQDDSSLSSALSLPK